MRAALRRGGEPADGSARDRTITGAAGLRIDISRHEVHVGAHLLALTKTEFNILEALASVKGRVVTQSDSSRPLGRTRPPLIRSS